MASGAGQSAVITSLLDHGAEIHAGTRVGDCSTALGVCTLVLWLSSFPSIFNLIRNTHQLVVGMTVHEILDMVAYVHMYAW